MIHRVIFDTDVDNLINSLYGNINSCALSSDDSNTEQTYIVKAGDTLYSIASRYNTTVDLLKKLNNLTSNILRIGQILYIPNDSNTSNINYVVKSGDTLYSIAKRYNVSIDAIKKLNNLTNNTLLIGQVLKIPVSEKEDYINYTVKSGDTLYSIASRYNTTVNKIKDLNNLKSNIIVIGDVLKIPLS